MFDGGIMRAMKRVDYINVRFDSAAQLELIKKAAKVKKWSVNRFAIEFLTEAAKSVTANGSEPLMVSKEPPALNQ